MKEPLHSARRAVTFTGANHRGRDAERHFPGKTGTRKRGDAVGRGKLAQNPAHGLARFKFDALGHADHDGRMPFQFRSRLPERLRGNGQHQTLGAAHRFFKICFNFPVGWQFHAGQITFAVPVPEFRQRFGIDVPKRHGIAVFVQHLGQRRSPGARAQHRNFHFTPS